MGKLKNLLGLLFGRGGNVIAQTASVFRENTEASAQRRADYNQAALGQLSSEFQVARRGWFDRFMDGLNRLPRPLIVIATFALFLRRAAAPGARPDPTGGKIASEHGLKPVISDSLKPQAFAYLAQTTESDLNFLTLTEWRHVERTFIL